VVIVCDGILAHSGFNCIVLIDEIMQLNY